MNIVLHRPEIPHNTGAIGRTCLSTGTKLHLIRPYGFSLSEKAIRRSGMDYWQKVDVQEYDSFQAFLTKNPAANFYLVETGESVLYSDVKYKQDDYIIFGNESSGLPKEILEKYPARQVRLPMTAEGRSLNLSVCAGIVLYEALRQNDFVNLI